MRNTTRTLLALLLSLLFLQGCKYIRNIKNDDLNPVVARAYSAELYKMDIPNIVPDGTSTQDSLAIVNKYIDNWVSRQVVLYNASKSMSAEDLNKEIEDFRRMLLLGRYEQQVLNSSLDTLVTERQIEDYYEANSQNFVLARDIVRWSYLPVTYVEESFLKQLKSEFSRTSAPAKKRGEEPTEMPWTWESGVEKIMTEAGYSAPFVKDQWIEVDNLSAKYETPDDFTRNISQKNNYTFEIKNNQGVYLGRITRYMRKGSVAPLEYASRQVKSIILNLRKAETLQKAEQKLKEEALKNQKIEIFTSENENK